MDVCPACGGIWLDKGELGKLASAERVANADDEREGSDSDGDDNGHGGGRGGGHGEQRGRRRGGFFSNLFRLRRLTQAIRAKEWSKRMGADIVFVGRMLLAALLSFAIGWEREARGSPAGDRTYALIGLGAAAFTSVGVDAFPATAEKLIAGVVTGVGFLGAGMILKEGRDVIGLTTAASIWAVAAVGVVVGAGEHVMGVSLAIVIVLVLVLEMDRLPGLSYFEAGNIIRRRGSDCGRNDR